MNNKIKTLLITTILSIGLGQNTYADRTYMCKACPAGTFANDNKCDKCPAGSYCVNGIKRECPQNLISNPAGVGNQIAGTVCIPCSDGAFPEDNICKSCPAGFFCKSGDIKRECPDGTYAPTKSSASCLKCELPVEMAYNCINNQIPPSITYRDSNKGHKMSKTLTTGQNFFSPIQYDHYSLDVATNCYNDKMKDIRLYFGNMFIDLSDDLFDVELSRQCDKIKGYSDIKLFFTIEGSTKPQYFMSQESEKLWKEKETARINNICEQTIVNNIKNSIYSYITGMAGNIVSKTLITSFKITSNGMVNRKRLTANNKDDKRLVCEIALQQQ